MVRPVQSAAGRRGPGVQHGPPPPAAGSKGGGAAQGSRSLSVSSVWQLDHSTEAELDHHTGRCGAAVMRSYIGPLAARPRSSMYRTDLPTSATAGLRRHQYCSGSATKPRSIPKPEPYRRVSPRACSLPCQAEFRSLFGSPSHIAGCPLSITNLPSEPSCSPRAPVDGFFVCRPDSARPGSPAAAVVGCRGCRGVRPDGRAGCFPPPTAEGRREGAALPLPSSPSVTSRTHRLPAARLPSPSSSSLYPSLPVLAPRY